VNTKVNILVPYIAGNLFNFSKRSHVHGISYLIKLGRKLTGFPPQHPGFYPRSGYMRFEKNKMGVGQGFR
jgi:hypothetical protein